MEGLDLKPILGGFGGGALYPELYVLSMLAVLYISPTLIFEDVFA
jgi:hypothetical protein